jgi:hypothetical protein
MGRYHLKCNTKPYLENTGEAITTRDPVRVKTISEYFSLDLIPDPSVILQPDGTIVDVNAGYSKLVGSDKKGIIGTHYRDIEPLKMLGRKLGDASKNNREYIDLIVFRERHFEILLSPFATELGSKLIRVMFKDITNFVSLEKASGKNKIVCFRETDEKNIRQA